MATWIILILKDMDLYTLLHNCKRTSGVYISVWNLFETRYLFFLFGKMYLHNNHAECNVFLIVSLKVVGFL